jgi:hypothetical protein
MICFPKTDLVRSAWRSGWADISTIEQKQSFVQFGGEVNPPPFCKITAKKSVYS